MGYNKMIETFFVSQLYKSFKHNNTQTPNDNYDEGNEGIAFILKIGLIIWATYLAWECNKARESIYKIGIPIFAFFFSVIYLIYYGIYRKLLQNPCKFKSNKSINI